MWTFDWYPDGTNDPWATWYHSQSCRVQATHDRVIDFLNSRERSDWTVPYFKKLTGYDDLFEIVIKAGVQHRLFGTFQRGKVFVVVLAAIHKGKVYTPKNALETAERRIIEVINGTVRPIQCERP